MKKIVDFFVKNIVNSPKFNSPNPVSDMDLLLPEFKNKFAQCVVQYKTKYPDQDVVFAETYRSNTLQEQYYNSGASKIKKDGMHHFGIAGDSIFVINGKRTYKGDVNLLRKIYKENGLTILGMWDPLHVQFIAVEEQAQLREMVNATLKTITPTTAADITNAKSFMITDTAGGNTAVLNIEIKDTDPGHSEIKIKHNTVWVQTVTTSTIVSIQHVMSGDIIDIDCSTLGNVTITISGVDADKDSVTIPKPGGTRNFNIEVV